MSPIIKHTLLILTMTALLTVSPTATAQEKRAIVVQGKTIIVERDFKKILDSSDDMVSPDDSTYYLKKAAPTSRLWWEPDDSMKIVNEKVGERMLFSDEMIQFMGWGLLGKEFNQLACEKGWCKEKVPGIFEALYRAGSDCQITNILHQALLAPTNHYREATFRAYVMASPVPMTVLAETVVKEIPLEERRAWYAGSGSKTLETHSWIDRSIDRPSREALRCSHFLNLIKTLETDRRCLRIIGDLVDPKWE
jgi:hypothetical protein